MIYLDHHAATPIHPRVRAAMAAARAEAWPNPSSAHAPGRAARRLLEQARERIATQIGARPADIVLTAGGTEACNLGVLGLVPGARRVVCTAVEHPAVAEPLAEREPVQVPVLGGLGPPPTEVHLGDAELACFQLVNHETGSILDVPGYASRCRQAGVPLFVDATAALGKIDLNVEALGASAVALASSKIGGPPGAGALWIARDASLVPRQLGGAQERGRRAGSPDTLAVVGFGVAAELASERAAQMPRVAVLRDRLESALVELGGVVNGARGPRVSTVTNVSFRGWSAPRLVAALDLEGVCGSAGAACSSGVDGPSPVILAMHPDEPWRAASSLRLSLGPSTTDAEIEGAIDVLRRVLPRSGTSALE